MTHIIIDRTVENKKKSSANRAKFVKRASARIKEAVKDFISNDADIKSIADGKQKKIKISSKTLNEPQLVFDKNRSRKQVVIGNKDFVVGDTIDKPGGGGGKSREGGPGEESEDDFYFNLSHKEFLNIFFDGLELPDLVKKQLFDECEKHPHHTGFTTSGPPVRLDLRKTLVNSIKRTAAIGGNIDLEIEELEAKLVKTKKKSEKDEILLLIEELKKQKETIPFLEELDLRYRNIEMIPEPTTKAVMFCILDVSGSMSDWHKEVAKRFFMILYLFLTKQYDNVDLVFIKHHHEAYEVDEHDFFYSRATGGTIVSEAIKLTNSIIKERYPTNIYNAYVCQISDGDNWGDNGEMAKLEELVPSLLSRVQYFAFVDVKNSMFSKKSEDTVLMQQYKSIKEDNAKYAYKFSLRSIMNMEDVYAVFRSLFEKYRKEDNDD